MGHPLVPTLMVTCMGQHKHHGQKACTGSACSDSVGPLVGQENNSVQMRQSGSGILHTMPLQQRGDGDAAAKMPIYDICTPQFLPPTSHIAGAANGPADAISQNSLHLFHAQAPTAQAKGTQLSAALVQLFSQPASQPASQPSMNWISSNWRQLFMASWRQE